MARLKTGFVSGTVSDNPLTSGATTLNSDGLASLPVISSPDIAAITLDPEGSAGAPEIVWVTAHSSSATSATISRGQENTTARSHAQDIPWVHGPTTLDYAQTKEIFVTPLLKQDDTETLVLPFTHAANPATLAQLDDDEWASMGFRVPPDFTSLVSADILYVSNTSSIEYTVTFGAAGVGENYAFVPDTLEDTASPTTEIIDEIDVSSLMEGNIEAGDLVGIKIQASATGGNFSVIGLSFIYN